MKKYTRQFDISSVRCTSQEELSSGTLKDKGIEADQRTPGEEESSKR